MTIDAEQLAQAMVDTLPEDEVVAEWAQMVRDVGAECYRYRAALKQISDGPFTYADVPQRIAAEALATDQL